MRYNIKQYNLPNRLKNKIILILKRNMDNYFLKHIDKTIVSNNYLEALMQNSDYFYVELRKCIDPYGYSYGDGWHFFTSIVKNLNNFSRNEVISNFEKFLKLFYHENVFDGFSLKFKKSNFLKDYSPPCLAFLTPWSPFNLAQIEEQIAMIIEEEKLVSKNNIVKDNPLNEPNYIAANHYDRLYKLSKSVLVDGYQFMKDPHDPVKGFVLSYENDYRILIFSGQHRVSVLSGLGYKKVPIKFVFKYIIRVEDVDEWPLVKIGHWDRDDALMYFHHLFNYDSLSWALANDLLLE